MVGVSNAQLTPDEAIVELERTWSRQQHIAGLAYELSEANLELCDEATSYDLGIEWLTLADFPNDNFRSAGSQLGVGRLPFVTITTPQSAAARAGIVAGDILLKVNGSVIPEAPEKYITYIEVLGVRVPTYRHKIDGLLEPASNEQRTIAITVLRHHDELHLELVPIESCDFRVLVFEDSKFQLENVGTNILISSSLIDHTHSDEETKMMIAHQMAHILSKHGTKKTRNAAISGVAGATAATAIVAPFALIGALVGEDVSAAGDLIGLAAGASSSVGGGMFALRHEREADYVAVYLLERAGIDSDDVSKVWSRSPLDTRLSKTHQSIEKRLKNIEMTVEEIDSKRLAGLPLIPSEELKPVSVED